VGKAGARDRLEAVGDTHAFDDRRRHCLHRAGRPSARRREALLGLGAQAEPQRRRFGDRLRQPEEIREPAALQLELELADRSRALAGLDYPDIERRLDPALADAEVEAAPLDRDREHPAGSFSDAVARERRESGRAREVPVGRIAFDLALPFGTVEEPGRAADELDGLDAPPADSPHPERDAGLT